jgi:hypothetical protein
LPSPPSGARRAQTLVLLAATEGIQSSGVSMVANGLVGASCTRVLLADAVAVRPTTVAGEGIFCRPCPFRRSPCRGSPWTRCRIHQFLVGRGESTNGGREGQVGSRELLKHGHVVGGRKSQINECHFKPLNCRPCRRKHTVSPAKRLPPPRPRSDAGA